MAERQHREKEYIFRNVQLFKNDTLGTGSYGAVCKAKCDQLLCAAKLLYPVLFQMSAPDPGKEHRRPFRRFETECAFLSRVNHPNIVQYLGTYRDPDTNAPVLLMELMDESLTHFLESSPGDIPYHIQVNLSYDIAQALAFLHSNGIIHRDLSSNNVLLIAGSRAKVTDFGMSKFRDINVTRLATMTTCPGTPAFMSPEALNEPPVYTEKLDNFSFGVLLVQITTRQFPKPTDRFDTVQLPDPRSPGRTVEAKLPIQELDRRQAQISLIDPTHLLLPIARHCLKDRDVERPSSQQLCQTLDALKRTALYQESSQQDLHQMLREKDEQLQRKQQIITEKDKQIQTNQQMIREKNVQITQKDTQLQTNQETIIRNNEQLHTKDCEIQTLQHETEARERQLRRLDQELQSSKENTAALQQAIDQRDREVTQLRQTLASKNEEIHNLSTRMHQVALQDEIPATSMKPVVLPDAPDNMRYGSSVVIGDKAYFSEGYVILGFSKNQWHELPPCPNNLFTIVSVDGTLTTVGGRSESRNKLYSYINNKWVKHFSPMPTGRCTPGAVYANNTLVVAGGSRESKILTIVEILNTAIMQWSIVSSLPVPTNQPSTTICGDYVYIHQRADDDQEKHPSHKCSLKQLTQSQPRSAIWEKIATLPVSWSSLVTVNGHLLAVGGRDSNRDTTKNIYQYNMRSWTVVSQMLTPRSSCLTAVLPGSKLMVVGGDCTQRKCEITTFV